MPVSKARASSPQTTKPYWSTTGATLYLGDVRKQLQNLPMRSVHCVITSPPYWGLRDYRTAVWEGGDQACGHESARTKGRADYGFSEKSINQRSNTSAGFPTYSRMCPTCGARRIDMQIGTEPSPDCGTHGQAQCGECFVCNMVSVFREVHRVLRDDGTLWLNLGDSYSFGGRGGGAEGSKQQTNAGALLGAKHTPSIPDGNLVGIPWRVALALQADGWVLRQDIIWYSPNKIPESVQNRCTKSHEHIFLLAKGPDYYYDSVAVEKPAKESSIKREAAGFTESDHDVTHRKVGGVDGQERLGLRDKCRVHETANKRDVWIVPTRGYSGAHFATFSPELITPCILAGTSEHGTCAACGRPWRRQVVRVGGVSTDSNNEDSRDRSFRWSRNGLPSSGSTLNGTVARRETVGWRKMCGCYTDEIVPAVVLDPFVGCYDSSTLVATRRGFIPWPNVTDSDEFLSLSPAGVIDYARSTKIIVSEYEGNMHHYIGRSVDLLVTPNHQMLAREHHSERTQLVQSQHMQKRWWYIPMQCWTSSEGLALDVAELARKLGYAVSIGRGLRPDRSKLTQYNVGLSIAKETKLDLSRMRHTEQYHGMVYCADVPPHHTLLVCRNGKIAWCGNSGTTVATALEMGRHGVGIDLSEDYLRDHAIPRIEAVISGTVRQRPTSTLTAVASSPPLAPRRMRG